MPRFVVTVGYECKTLYFREVEVSADDAASARVAALRRVSMEPAFWCAAQEADGESSPTAILDVTRQR